VYFLNTDRIARNVAYQNLIIAEILRYNKQLIINGKDYVSNPENEFTLTVLGAVAQFERAKIMERHSRGKLHKLRQGVLQSNGHNVFGYDYIPRTTQEPPRLEINSREAKIVSHIFKAYATENASWSRLARDLEEVGALTKLGKRLWDTEKLRNILKNHTYTGTRYFNTRTFTKEEGSPIRSTKYGKRVFKDRSEWIPVKVPSIVTQELFNKVQARLESQRKEYRNPKQTRLLSGLITCGMCGRFYTSYFRTYKDQRRKENPRKIFHKTAYRCSWVGERRMHSRLISVEKCGNPEVLSHLLESCVAKIIEETMSDPKMLIRHLNKPEGKSRTSQWRVEKKLKHLDQKISELIAEKSDMVDMYASGKIDRPTYAEMRTKQDDKIAEAKSERADLISRIPLLHKKDIVEVSVQRYCESVKARFAICKDPESQREFMKDYINEVIYNNTKVVVKGSVPVKLKVYEDPDQPSEMSEINFNIEGEIKRGNKWHPKSTTF
jgi:site-specific DNA recombinase